MISNQPLSLSPPVTYDNTLETPKSLEPQEGPVIAPPDQIASRIVWLAEYVEDYATFSVTHASAPFPESPVARVQRMFTLAGRLRELAKARQRSLHQVEEILNDLSSLGCLASPMCLKGLVAAFMEAQ